MQANKTANKEWAMCGGPLAGAVMGFTLYFAAGGVLDGGGDGVVCRVVDIRADFHSGHISYPICDSSVSRCDDI